MNRANRLGLIWGIAMLLSVVMFGFNPWSIGIPAAFFLGLLAYGVFRPASGILMPVIRRGPAGHNQVALTFDDGPDPELTPHILDLLNQYEAQASFFCIGKRLKQYSGIAHRIHSEGHELGNHSYSHSRLLNFAAPRTMQSEIERGAEAIRNITGCPKQPFYRPPIGLKSPPLALVRDRMGLNIIAWSIHSHDSRTTDPEKVARRVTSRLRDGDIVLLHDGHDLPAGRRSVTAQALEPILAHLQKQNLKAVTLSELLCETS